MSCRRVFQFYVFFCFDRKMRRVDDTEIVGNWEMKGTDASTSRESTVLHVNVNLGETHLCVQLFTRITKVASLSAFKACRFSVFIFFLRYLCGSNNISILWHCFEIWLTPHQQEILNPRVDIKVHGIFVGKLGKVFSWHIFFLGGWVPSFGILHCRCVWHINMKGIINDAQHSYLFPQFRSKIVPPYFLRWCL